MQETKAENIIINLISNGEIVAQKEVQSISSNDELDIEIDLDDKWLDNTTVIVNNTLGILSLSDKLPTDELSELGIVTEDERAKQNVIRSRCWSVLERVLEDYETYYGLI